MDVLVTIHSVFRWVVLAALVGAAIYGVVRALRRDPWSPGSARPFAIATVVLDIQVLIGIVLWILSQGWEANPFLAIIHPVVMLLAVGVAHVAVRRSRANGARAARLLDRRARVVGDAGAGAGRHTLGVVRRLAMAALILSAVACASEHGPWVDADGNRVPNGLILEFDGPSSCGWSSVTFIRFFGDAVRPRPGEGTWRTPGPWWERSHLRRGDRAAGGSGAHRHHTR